MTAGADPIRGELWIRRDLMEIVAPGTDTRETGEPSERELAALDELLEDARWAFSGMIYGFDVAWTPSAASRDVAEELEIVPVALIPRGDPRMRTVSVVEEDGFIHVLLEYSPDASQRSRLEGWAGQAYPAASGVGEAPVLTGVRRDAMEAAIRETLRAWLRAREYNRPREVTGRIALRTFPETGLRAGSVTAKVSLRMDLDPLRHYAVD